MKPTGIATWTALAVAACLYATMTLWTLPEIAQAAGGLPPFDMRPGGYDFDEARRHVP